MTASEPVIESSSDERQPSGLSFGDGFQFGCGFFSAGLLAGVIFVLILLLLGIVLSLTGAGLLGNLLG